MRLNYSHLYYFYVVAMEGSIKNAALKLHVTQPTISDQIKLLEEAFGCDLFERRNRALFLTRDGELALEYATQIFDLGATLTSRLRHRSKSPKVSVTIGVGLSMSQYLLYEKLLPLFAAAGIMVRVRENERHLLLADLEEGNIDMVLTDSREGVTQNMMSYRVGVNRTFAVAHQKFRKAKTGFPASLSKIPFFNYTADSFLHYEIELYFAKHGVVPKIVGEADDIDLLQLVTEREIAFTIVPEAAKIRFCKNPDVVVLGEIADFQSAVYGIINREDRGVVYEFLRNLPKTAG